MCLKFQEGGEGGVPLRELGGVGRLRTLRGVRALLIHFGYTFLRQATASSRAVPARSARRKRFHHDLKDTAFRLAVASGGSALKPEINLTDTEGEFHSFRREFAPNSSNVQDNNESTAEMIDLEYNHGYSTGDKVIYSNGSDV